MGHAVVLPDSFDESRKVDILITLEPVPRKKRWACWRCNGKTCLTWHHVYPRRHRSQLDPSHHHIVGSVCRKCHDELEKRIPLELQPLTFYVDVWLRFLEAAH